MRRAELVKLTAPISLAILEEEEPELSRLPALGKRRVEHMTPDERKARRRAQNRYSSQRARSRRRAVRERRNRQVVEMRKALAVLTGEVKDIEEK
eukprot:CAMPEP_0174901828 /NCGR_PEP_ID=MMETSP0167-20121228/35881_1 /TAXON_ID=38298 /ORGANISM="Rhodella maculata, Strain CCMP736" /LENGTH=94 /DNA_ID=CAMNT_0016143635 /DNA_START=155 /DNA_END=439 /DNA_ORIENTATION=-